MENYIFLGIIVVALVVIAAVVVRKFPQVANLDLENFAEEQEARKKREIISKRLEEHGREAKKRWAQRLRPVVQVWRRLQLKFRIYVGKIERLLHHQETSERKEVLKQMTGEEKEFEINELLQQAENHFVQNNYDKAEELYIAAIKIDKKCVPAYKGLADTYSAKGNNDEAFQTYDFLSRLLPNDDALLVKLGEIAEEKGMIEQAIHYYEKATTINDSLSPRFYHLAELLMKAEQPEVAIEAAKQAVDLEPKNPKYLDLLIEIAIICGVKDEALKAFEELRLVNPENQKLAELKEKIDKMG